MVSLYFNYAMTGNRRDAIDKVMSSSIQAKAFLRFCISEWSVENYLAYLCAANYRKWPTNNKLQAYLMCFCGPQAPMEINVSSALINQAVATMRAAGAGRRPASTVLDEIDRTVRVNLADTLSRFNTNYTKVTAIPGLRDGYWQDDKTRREMKKARLSDQSVRDVLARLKWAGYPTNHFGLTDGIGLSKHKLVG